MAGFTESETEISFTMNLKLDSANRIQPNLASI